MNWLFKRDTKPLTGGYTFSWNTHGFVLASSGDTVRPYAVEALQLMSRSKGFSQDDREMAIAALDWISEHPYERKSHEYNTTPGL